MWLRVISVRTRLVMGFLVLLGLMASVGVLAAGRLSELRQTIKVATQDVPQKVEAANTLIDAVNEGARFKLAVFAARSPELLQSSSEGVARARERINQSYKLLDQLFDPDKGADPSSVAALQEVKRLRVRHASSFDRAAEVKKSGNVNEADRLLAGEVLPTLADYVQGIKQFIAIQQAQVAEEARLADAKATKARSWILWLCAIAGLIGLLVAHAIHRSVSVPLAELTLVARSLAEGDCSVRIAGAAVGDEVGVLASAMSEMASAEQTLSDAAHRLAKGDIDADLVVRGKRDVLGAAMVQLKATLRELDVTVGSLTQAAREGRLDERAPADSFQGSFGALVGGLNATLDAIVEPHRGAPLTASNGRA